jgi:hypothetical protein
MSSWEAMISLTMWTNIRGTAAATLPTAGALVAASVATPQSKANGSIGAKMVLTTAPDSGRPKDTDQKSLLAVKLIRPLLRQRVDSKHFIDESWSKD